MEQENLEVRGWCAIGGEWANDPEGAEGSLIRT